MAEAGPTIVPDAVVPVAPDALRPSLRAELDAGGRFVMLVGLDDRGLAGAGVDAGSPGMELGIEAVAMRPDGTLARYRAPLPLETAGYPSITPAVPAAHWDEREARDLLGIVPIGHPDPRRLVLHERWPRGYHPLRKDVSASERPPEADRRFVPFEVHGEGVYQLPVGPIHAGIIEPGHFRFSAMGERVLHLDARLFFTHRGLEKLVEGRRFAAAAPVVERACGVCTVTHALAYAQAVEGLVGATIPDRAAWVRVLLAELERLYNHVGDLGNLCAGIGFTPGVARLGWLKERLLRANDAIAGHRYLMGVIVPGGLAFEPDPDGLATLPATLDEAATEMAGTVRSLLRSEGVMARFHGAGAVPTETAEVLGALGVAARAAGIATDLRVDRPYAAYAALGVDVVTATSGDVAARFHVRAQEAHESVRLVREALARLPGGPIALDLREAPAPAPGASTLAAAEGPRGASWVWLRAGAGGTIDRLRLRSASFANWPVVAAAVPGDLVPDFPLINKSFELCYACTDR